MNTTIRIVRASSREKPDLLTPARFHELTKLGLTVLYDDLPAEPEWPFTAAAAPKRAQAVTDAILEYQSEAILCARGGYGASDLLDLLPWDKLKKAKPKLIVGFSDVSALHSAFLAKFGWQGLHAPMPATTLWGQNQQTPDIDLLVSLIHKQTTGGKITLRPLNAATQASPSGWLFGGCFAVLTNLIGTPYFPRSLKQSILFLEDTGETPGRLMRFWQQWRQSGVISGIAAVVLGNFRFETPNPIHDYELFCHEFAKRCPVPVYASNDFGHISPNYPLAVGSSAQIIGTSLSWNLNSDLRIGPEVSS